MAEHRSMQHSALLDAARSLLSEGGTEALTFPALAERTGLARSSVYEYFRSRAAVVEELCAVDFPVWAAEIEAAMKQADTPEGKIEAYVRRQLALVGDQRHRAVVAISASELDDGAREKIRAAHGDLIAMIVEALDAMGHGQPRLAAMLLQGIVDAAVRRIEHARGEDPGAITEAAVGMALGGVRGERGRVPGQPGPSCAGSGTPITGSRREGPGCSSEGDSSESGSA
ncbi:TetR family transcriptional regulator [Streptomyces sulfonofaciens]|uniref:TetR family transcriptional regulator n=1 Tax=Streptomyces sulfonofaciens TaxID=68272 RepID=A0A919L6E1_9ACTN|nr:TetR family transcriptional regulator [Streptomyces sulfonofaciens]